MWRLDQDPLEYQAHIPCSAETQCPNRTICSSQFFPSEIRHHITGTCDCHPLSGLTLDLPSYSCQLQSICPMLVLTSILALHLALGFISVTWQKYPHAFYPVDITVIAETCRSMVSTLYLTGHGMESTSHAMPILIAVIWSFSSWMNVLSQLYLIACLEAQLGKPIFNMQFCIFPILGLLVYGYTLVEVWRLPSYDQMILVNMLVSCMAHAILGGEHGAFAIVGYSLNHPKPKRVFHMCMVLYNVAEIFVRLHLGFAAYQIIDYRFKVVTLYACTFFTTIMYAYIMDYILRTRMMEGDKLPGAGVKSVFEAVREELRGALKALKSQEEAPDEEDPLHEKLLGPHKFKS